MQMPAPMTGSALRLSNGRNTCRIAAGESQHTRILCCALSLNMLLVATMNQKVKLDSSDCSKRGDCNTSLPGGSLARGRMRPGGPQRGQAPG